MLRQDALGLLQAVFPNQEAAGKERNAQIRGGRAVLSEEAGDSFTAQEFSPRFGDGLVGGGDEVDGARSGGHGFSRLLLL